MSSIQRLRDETDREKMIFLCGNPPYPKKRKDGKRTGFDRSYIMIDQEDEV